MNTQEHAQAHAGPKAKPHKRYWVFGVQLLVSAVIMYLVMYLMIDSLDHFYNNLNVVYMTLAMVAPMAIVMMLAMPSMFHNRGLNIVLYAVFGALLVVGVWFTREQILIGDEQFLRAMIPHHSGAILMCEQAQITDPAITGLCEQIVQAQKEEIAQMEAILKRY